MKVFTVGVFEGDPRRSGHIPLLAYTLWYSRTWSGCCEHKVEAEDGTAAKKLAMKVHREVCMTRIGGGQS